jgi:hypothetical protein
MRPLAAPLPRQASASGEDGNSRAKALFYNWRIVLECGGGDKSTRSATVLRRRSDPEKTCRECEHV